MLGSVGRARVTAGLISRSAHVDSRGRCSRDGFVTTSPPLHTSGKETRPAPDSAVGRLVTARPVRPASTSKGRIVERTRRAAAAVVLGTVGVLVVGLLGMPASGAGSAERPSAMHRCFPASAPSVPTHGLRRGPLHGDLDGRHAGTRRADTVWTTARLVNGVCRYWLVAKLDTGVTRYRVAGSRDDLGRTFFVDDLARVDRRQGLEISVVVAEGASTGFMRLFTVRAGRLVAVDARGPGAVQDDVFPYGGSVTGLVGVDCARNRGPGAVVASRAVLNRAGTRYRVVRRFYRSVDADLVRTGAAQHRVVPARRIERLHEFGGRPFPTCAVVRAHR